MKVTPKFTTFCQKWQSLSQKLFWCNFEKLVWFPRFGTSFTILLSLLKILRGRGHFDPTPRLPFSKKPKVGRVKADAVTNSSKSWPKEFWCDLQKSKSQILQFVAQGINRNRVAVPPTPNSSLIGLQNLPRTLTFWPYLHKSI